MYEKKSENNWMNIDNTLQKIYWRQLPIEWPKRSLVEVIVMNSRTAYDSVQTDATLSTLLETWRDAHEEKFGQ